MGHNRENFGALLKSTIDNLKSIIDSGLAPMYNLIYPNGALHFRILSMEREPS